MKNVQIIDEAINASYDIYSVTDDEFYIIFPEIKQNIEFIEDLVERLGDDNVFNLMRPVWDRIVNKEEVCGINGTLFYGLPEKKPFYPEKRHPPITNRLIP